MPLPQPVRRTPHLAGGGRLPPLALLGGVLLALGLLVLLGLFDVAGLRYVAILWRSLLGWAAIPVALALVWAGGALIVGRNASVWDLPWGRTAALEVVVLALLAILAGVSGQARGGPGGLVGWALSSGAGHALGGWPAGLLWLAALAFGTLVFFRVGARQIAATLESFADTLAEPTTAVPVMPSPTPAAVPPRPAASVTAVATAAVATGPKPAPQQPLPAPTVTAAPAARATRPPRLPARPAHLPDLSLLDDDVAVTVDAAAASAMAERIVHTLDGFGVPVEMVAIEQGPTVTRFGLRPGVVTRAGQPVRVKVAQIKALRDDLALALAVRSLRIEAPVAGQALVGIEVPNLQTDHVGLKGLLTTAEFTRASQASGLALALGRDVSGGAVVGDLARMPHLLVAGTTGSGKSVCLHSVLACLLFQNSPDTLRLVLIDPKRVELARYRGLPHLMAPVVTDVSEVIGSLKWAVAELDSRYKRFAAEGARDRATYNARRARGEAPLPALVVLIDELADLMLTAPDETEPLLARLAQLGRAAGIHLVLATQRPSTDVVTGLIKANFPARIAFAVASGIDSRVILDQTGAENLVGRGDLLYQPPDAPQPRRAQGAFVSDDELGRLLSFWQASHWHASAAPAPWADLVPTLDPEEALYEEAVRLARQHTSVSASFLQRKLHVGYARARDLYERLVEEGVVDDSAGLAAETHDDDLDWVDGEFGAD